MVDAYNAQLSASEAYDWAYERVQRPEDGQNSMSFVDVLGDVDAMAFGLAIKADPSVSISYLLQGGYRDDLGSRQKFASFRDVRFGGAVGMQTTFENVFAPLPLDPFFSALRGAWWLTHTGDVFELSVTNDTDRFSAVALGAAAGIQNRYA